MPPGIRRAPRFVFSGTRGRAWPETRRHDGNVDAVTGRAALFTPMKIQNLGLRLAAVLLAVALFLHVRTEAREDRLLEIPLRWKNLPAGLVIKDPVPNVVEVKVRANGKQF